MCKAHLDSMADDPSAISSAWISVLANKKFELMLTKCAKAYSSSGSVV